MIWTPSWPRDVLWQLKILIKYSTKESMDCNYWSSEVTDGEKTSQSLHPIIHLGSWNIREIAEICRCTGY
jgi:hypothetical protein